MMSTRSIVTNILKVHPDLCASPHYEIDKHCKHYGDCCLRRGITGQQKQSCGWLLLVLGWPVRKVCLP